MKNRVVKASGINYWDPGQPSRLYQIAEDYFRRAEEYQAACSYGKAKIYYQKAEEWFLRARDAYQTKRQTDEAKKQAGAARRQAMEARNQAGELYIPPKAARNTFKFQPRTEPQEFTPVNPVRRQQPKPNRAFSPAPKQAEKLPALCGMPGTPVSPPPSVIPDVLDNNAHHPISWRGKRHG